MGAQPGRYEVEQNRKKLFTGKEESPYYLHPIQKEQSLLNNPVPLGDEPGPFPSEDTSEQSLKNSAAPNPLRDFDCQNYDTCLSLAAALDWKSFTCQGCARTVNSQLLWRAHQKVRSDPGLAKLCSLPILT